MWAPIVLLGLGFYFLTQSRSFSLILGIVLLSHGVNFMIFSLSNPEMGQSAFWDRIIGAPDLANDPIPQALVLTAIVIGFALLFYLVAMLRKLEVFFPGGDLNLMRKEDD
ncbi:sodium:proton antiporter [Pseudobacteriovorax antillogorgiicola]|nr:NADH-quinone oxidoreductase subunit K [Pseudobacteriovorax antillogorgiicola]